MYDRCNALLATDGFRVRGLLEKSRVYALYTTDDPADSLHAHAALKTAYPTVKVLPAFRPDRAVHCHKPGFAEYLDTLAEAAGMPINTLADLEQALSAGSRISMRPAAASATTASTKHCTCRPTMRRPTRCSRKRGAASRSPATICAGIRATC